MGSGGPVYLVNYPDGTHTAHDIVVGVETMSAGDELADGWLIDQIRIAKPGHHSKEGVPIAFEVWVRPAEP